MTQKTAKASEASRKKRHRRTESELISDLESKIQKLKERAASRAVKKSPAMRHTVAAVRSIDKAMESAAAESNTTLRHSLADAREPLVAYLQLEGIKLPKVGRPRGRRPKAE